MHNWQSEIKRLFVILVIASLVGLLLDQLLLACLLALLCYAAFNIIQLRRLHKWLSQDIDSRRADPPESIGLWGDIFDGIYRLQNQERKASAYLANIIDKAQESSAALEIAVIMINKQSNLDWWNLASEKMLGLKYPQDRNQAVTNLIRNPAFAEYFQNENYTETLKMAAPGKLGRVLEFQIALFGEHERLMIVRDITQLQRLERMRKDFVGNVSHELATPITVIKGYLEAFLDNMQDLDNKWHKPIQQMHQHSMRMENIVRDLLILSSLETKTLPKHPKRINVTNLISEIEHDTRQMFQDKSHEIEIDCEEQAEITGKRRDLYSAISNLMVNAAKYTPPLGKISLKTAFTDDGFNIEVADNGIGIEPQHLPRLTERFYRVDVSRSTDTGGTGLGLAIVKHILMRHDAELQIKSKYGEGSRFICKFPLSRVSRIDAPASKADSTKPTLQT